MIKSSMWYLVESGINLGVNYQNSVAARGVAMEERRAHFPGFRITAGGAERSQQCRKYFHQ